ncbi:hypothetical protein UFOVP1279_32 [uncultured Caudovirales phage]|uniref:Uncharacterized protein n=1 Tax=uncultured Caudovirales phage TaxID=2100421 RepID=A0A6J5RT65_9CAUD|nr:hypothetical protein UFOVP1279_32 [uncultured Caudovirales phage]
MKNTPSEERAGKLFDRIEADEIVYSLVEKLVAAKEVKAEAEAAVDALQIAVMDLFKEYGLDASHDPFTGHSATLVTPSSIVVNEPKLKRKIGAKVYNKLCVLKFDKDKLNKALADGTVHIGDVAECSEEVDRKAYIRITKK